MSDALKAAEQIALKHAKACAIELVEQVAIEALKSAAKESANPIDDIVIAALAEPLKKALIDGIEKLGQAA